MTVKCIMNILCKCGKPAPECTYLRMCIKKSNIVGLLIYSDAPCIDKPNQLAIDDYVNKFNRRSVEWINSKFFEHIHLCHGSDMVIALLALSFQDLFYDIQRGDIEDPAQFNATADKIKLRIIEIARERIPFVFTFAKEIRYIYGSSKESKIHMELSWLLAGRKSYGKRASTGLLPMLYDLFVHNPNSKILLQIIVPDGSINSTTNKWYRYWDIKFHISSCGKIEDGETPYDALIRETQEEVDLDISAKINELSTTCVEGMCVHYCKLDRFISANYFESIYSEWQGFSYCKKCNARYYKHKPNSLAL